MLTGMSCGSPTVSGFLLNNSPTKKIQNDRNYRFRVSCASSSSVSDPYKTLRVRHGATESEVRSAFRKLALRYHPDVCKGNNCGVQFHEINEAYDIVMSKLREESVKKEKQQKKKKEEYYPEPEWGYWEEWMGYEGGCVRDYTSHINPYI